MVNNPDRGDSYVPTTSAAVYMPRRNHYIYNGTSWVKAGLLVEPTAATNLLLNSGTLSTQSVTVTAAAHTLHFTGTGTITLSGVSTAGPLVGTGTGENNRVSLTFTPTAGSLTLTVSGTVTNAQLELGSVPSSYIPTAGSTATRAAETVTVAAAKVPYPTPEVIGSELVTNGTFDTDLTGWVQTNGTTTVSGGVATFATSRITQTLTLEVGKVYQVTVDFSVGSGCVLRVGTGATGAAGSSINAGSLSPGSYSYQFVATATTMYVTIGSSAVGPTGDNVSIQEINPLSLWIQMDGYMTYADNNADVEAEQVRWYLDANNRLGAFLRTNSGTGEQAVYQVAAGVADTVSSAGTVYSPGINEAFNFASRHGSTFINGAVDGTAGTADTTPVALAALSATNLQLAYSGGPLIISKFRMGTGDIGNAGIAEASA